MDNFKTYSETEKDLWQHFKDWDTLIKMGFIKEGLDLIAKMSLEDATLSENINDGLSPEDYFG